jgi:hypothetical protein
LRYYFSGIDPRYGSVFDEFPQAGLMFSASTLLRSSTFDLFVSCLNKNRQIVLDSGIIQGWITEDNYLALLDAYGACFFWCAHYDEMCQFYWSNGHYNYARDYIGSLLGEKLLYVLQGKPEEGFTEAQYRAVMQVITHATPYIGVGGLGRLCRRGQFEAVERYLDVIYERLGPDTCQFVHLFGMGNYRFLSRYCMLFGSADSATWLCGVRGELLQPDGTRRRLQKPFDKLQALRWNVEMLLQWAQDWYALSREPQPPPSQSPRQIVPIRSPYILDTFPE